LRVGVVGARDIDGSDAQFEVRAYTAGVRGVRLDVPEIDPRPNV
jgi:hypothetical protein